MQHAEHRAIGVDIGGTKIHSVLIDGFGTVLTEDVRPTPAQSGVEAVIEAAAASATAVIDNAALANGAILEATGDGVRDQIRVVGVGVPGIVDAVRGTAVRAGNLAGWRNVPLVQELEQRLNLPVRIINDVRAGAYAEWLWGHSGSADIDASGDRPSPFLYVNIGTGIAAALIIEGSIYSGASNAAGELGHSILDPNANTVCSGCGKRGDVESLVAGPALARAYEQALRDLGDGDAGASGESGVGESGDPVRASTVLQLAQAGEELAVTVLERYVSYLGLALGNAITLYNPRLLVLGGGLGTAPALPLDEVREHAQRNAYEISWRAVTIEQARLGSAAGAIGAAGWALDEVVKEGQKR